MIVESIEYVQMGGALQVADDHPEVPRFASD
jgi:hypothetical protein